jgi:predicted Zn-dependent protease
VNKLISIALFAALGLAACGHSKPEPKRPADPLKTASASLLLKRGRAFAADGDTIRAEQYLVAASRRGAKDRDVVPPLMDACIRGQRFRAALAHAERFLARRPQDHRLRQLAASLYMATGQPDQAVQALEYIVEEEPEEPQPRYLLAMAHQQLDDTDSAVRELRTYLELQPTGALAREARKWLEAAGEDVDDGSDRRTARRHKRRGRR